MGENYRVLDKMEERDGVPVVTNEGIKAVRQRKIIEKRSQGFNCNEIELFLLLRHIKAGEDKVNLFFKTLFKKNLGLKNSFVF
jgi:hypothetical protein